MFLSPFQGDNLTSIPFALLWEIPGLVCLFVCSGGFCFFIWGVVCLLLVVLFLCH